MKNRLQNKKIMIAVVVIAIIVVLGIGSFVFYSINLNPVSSKSDTVSFEVKQGDTTSTVIARLKENNLIKNTTVTKLYVKFHGLNDVKAGNFLMDRSWDTAKILAILNDPSKAATDQVKITFKEGMWAKDVAKLLDEKLGIPRKELLALWNNDTYLKELMKSYPYLTKEILNKDYKVKLEGYLFPETYTFKKDADAKEVTKIFLDHFYTVYKKYETDIKKSKMRVQEIITLASMVQYEASTKKDMDMIAGVFYNRLNQNMPLDSSVTVCYALYDDMKSGEDCEVNTQIKSPYNTYRKTGLPIGPILNPGEDAIHAVLNPKKNDYLYFVADIYGNGSVHYSKTLAQQEANIDKYNLRK